MKRANDSSAPCSFPPFSGTSSCLLAGIAALTLRGAQARGLDLVRDGRPAAVIVAAAEAAPAAKTDAKGRPKARNDAEGCEELAVRILIDWVRKITDADLPVVAKAEVDRPALYVGRAAIAAGLKLDDIESPSREGLRVAVDEHRALIAGQNDTATVKAVCRFLEQLGCRYFMEGPIGEVYPRKRDLSVSKLSLAEKPGLRYRNPKGPSWRGGYWKLWNGAGGDAINHAHAWGRYIPKGLFADHPEYFAMDREGRRKEGDWLCTSNPELRALFAREVIAAVEAGTRNPSISPPDGRGYCRCPVCLAQDDPKVVEPSSGAVSVSRRYADFFDDVARRVAKVHPESVLSFYCYADYTQPPALGRRLSTNLCAVIAPIRYCRLHPLGHAGCPSRMQQVEMVEGWAREAARLGYYNYTYNLADATLPFFKFTAFRKELPWLADRGLDMMTLEVLSNWHIYGPQVYLGLRLAYDPRADAAAIMKDYWIRFYGPGPAPHMEAYWMGIDRALLAYPGHAGGFYGLQEIYTPALAAECRAHLERAAAAARSDPRHAERVALHAAGFESATDYLAVCAAMDRGAFGEALTLYEELMKRLRGLVAKGWANPEYGTSYLERFLGENLRAAAAATAPPARVRAVLPDEWRMAFDPDDQGVTNRYGGSDFDDAAWTAVRTRSQSLSAQGLSRTEIMWFRTRFEAPDTRGRLAMLFVEVDGLADVFVNGRRLDAADPGGSTSAPRRRATFEVDVTPAVRPGANTLAVRVDNRQMSELFLGGLVRPVVLVER